MGKISIMALLLAIPYTSLAAPATSSSVVFSDDYEGTAPQFGWDKHRIDGNGNIQAVTSPVYHGRQAAKFIVPDDGESYRSEVSEGSLGYGQFAFSFANYLPSDWQAADAGTIVAQWHGSKLSNGQDTNPPISLSVQNEEWFLKIHYLEKESDSKPVQKSFKLGSIETGRWNAWVLNITWSQQHVDGSLSLSLNGRTVASYRGTNNYHQKQAPYLKQGIYRPTWNPSKGHSGPTGGRDVIVYSDYVRVEKFEG